MVCDGSSMTWYLIQFSLPTALAYFLKTVGAPLPQGLCTHYFHYLEYSFPQLAVWFSPLLDIRLSLGTSLCNTTVSSHTHTITYFSFISFFPLFCSYFLAFITPDKLFVDCLKWTVDSRQMD